VQQRRTGKDGGSRPILIGIAAICVLALGLVGVALFTRGGSDHGDHPEAAITEAPADHPTATNSGGPSLHFSTTSTDLGLVPLGKEVGYTFSFANVGGKTLRIGDINVRALKGC